MTRCSSSCRGRSRSRFRRTRVTRRSSRRLRAGDVFGELALLDGAPRSATAIALVATQCAVLPRDAFRVLIAQEPAVRDALLASLAGELRRLTRHVEELALPRHDRTRSRRGSSGSLGGRHDRRRRFDPPSADDHPGRPGGDGRLHAPEREQAARPVRRRWAGPSRPRGHRRHGRAGAGGGSRGAEGAGQAVRLAAGASVEVVGVVSRRRFEEDRRGGQGGAMPAVRTGQEDSRRTRRSPAASRSRSRPRCRRVRGRARTAIPTSDPPSSRARRAKCTEPVDGLRVVVAFGSVGARPRRRRSRRGSWARAAGASAAIDLIEADPRHVPEEGRRGCRRCRSRPPPASSRGRRAALRWPRPRSFRRSPRRSRPARRGPCPQRTRRASLPIGGRRRRPRSGRRRPRPGHTSRRQGSSPAGCPRPGPRPPAIRRSPASRYVRDATSAPRPTASRRGSASSFHIGRISRGGPGRATMTPPLRPPDEPAGRGAVRVRECLGRRDQPGLLEVELRERASRAGVHRSRSHASVPGSTATVSSQRRRDRLAGQVVGCGPEPAGRYHEVGACQAIAERGRHRGEIVRQRGQSQDPHAEGGQSSGELTGVRVSGVADRQLAADAEKLGGQDAIRALGGSSAGA